jgi:DNA-binding response OmpR family regulator
MRQLTAESLVRSDSSDLTCESDLVEAVIRLKREKFAVALVDALVPDLAANCYRINSLHQTPLALITRGSKLECNEFRLLDADTYIPVESNSSQLLYQIGEISRPNRQQFDQAKFPVDILLIEDDPTIEESVRSAFRFYWPQASVYSASPGRPVLPMFAKKSPEVILLEIGLRDISAFLKRIRAFCPSPVIMVIDTKEESPIITAARLVAGGNFEDLSI